MVTPKIWLGVTARLHVVHDPSVGLTPVQGGLCVPPGMPLTGYGAGVGPQAERCNWLRHPHCQKLQLLQFRREHENGIILMLSNLPLALGAGAGMGFTVFGICGAWSKCDHVAFVFACNALLCITMPTWPRPCHNRETVPRRGLVQDWSEFVPHAAPRSAWTPWMLLLFRDTQVSRALRALAACPTWVLTH